jgi:glycosyltransferase involved in cell wall biosynthesis
VDDTGSAPPTDRSVCAILPAHDEADNLPEVVEELIAALAATVTRWRVVVVDDGSTDDTPTVLAELEDRHPQVHSLRLRHNQGKSAALRAGIEEVDTDLVLLLDADGQDDPSELPRMLAAVDAGADLVTGRRVDRQDRAVKRQTSRLYNWCTARLTGVPGSDFNSGFKLLRREVAEEVEIYGELHRYLPVLAAWAGFEVAEVPVNHRPRLHGRSKFGRNRFWRGMLDLVTVKFLTTYETRPFHLIGGTGLLLSFAGLGLLAWMLIERIGGGTVGNRPALLAGITLFVVGVQLVSVGLLAELMVALHRRRRSPVPRLAPRQQKRS